MRTATSARLLLGATLLVAGFGVLTDDSPVRNPLVQAAVGAADMKDRQCRKTAVAPGSACPVGCEARPLRSPEEHLAPPECHSRLWIVTCGNDCEPEEDYARLADGSLVDAKRLAVTLERDLDPDLMQTFLDARVRLTSRYDGLFRYDGELTSDVDLNKTKERLAAIPGVAAIDYVAK